MSIKRLLLVFALGIFLINISYAACPGGAFDTIIKLSNYTNAHAQIYNQSGYTIDICYSQIFGNYSGSSPHTCTGSNTLIWLSGQNNAHASTTQSTGYNTQVCYGNLACTVDQSPGQNCADSTRQVLLRLPGTTNAHLEFGNYYTYTSAKMCCKQDLGLKWLDSNGVEITKARVGDIVYATARNYNGNPDSTFDINEYSPFWIQTILSNIQGTISGLDFRYAWNITQTQAENLPRKFDPDTNFEIVFDINSLFSPYMDIDWCGDGIVNGPEKCDEGNNNKDSCTPAYASQGCSYCSKSCTEESVEAPYCGDGIVNGPEQCDKGSNNTNTCADDGSGSCSYCSAPGVSQGSGCKNVTIDFSNLFWANTEMGKITESEVGDTVLLIYPNGADYTGVFEIWEDDPVFDDDIRNITGVVIGNNLVGIWKITQADYNKGASDEASSDPYPEFRFTINERDVESEDALEITLPGKTSEESNLKTSILNPLCGDYSLRVGDSSMINYSVSDVDDLVDYKLIIDGVVVDEEKSVLSGQFAYNNLFNTKGTVNIRLEAKNDRGEKATAVSNVIVIDPSTSGNYVAACIKSPKNYEHISSEFAYFDATDSIALNFDSGTITIYSDDSMKYDWTFSDGTKNPYMDARAYQFYKYFQTKGKNWANVRVELA